MSIDIITAFLNYLVHHNKQRTAHGLRSKSKVVRFGPSWSSVSSLVCIPDRHSCQGGKHRIVLDRVISEAHATVGWCMANLLDYRAKFHSVGLMPGKVFCPSSGIQKLAH
eukprot:5770570-Amphidinium_carterae.1